MLCRLHSMYKIATEYILCDITQRLSNHHTVKCQFFTFNLEKITLGRKNLHRHRLWCLWQIWGMKLKQPFPIFPKVSGATSALLSVFHTLWVGVCYSLRRRQCFVKLWTCNWSINCCIMCHFCAASSNLNSMFMFCQVALYLCSPILSGGNIVKILLRKMFQQFNHLCLCQSVTFVKILIQMNVRIYSYQQNYTNEYLNIFILLFLTRTNVRIRIRIKNCTNIRIYSNIRLGFTL